MTVAEKLHNPDAYLTSRDFKALGLGRRAFDAIFELIGLEVPGYTRKRVVRVDDWIRLRESFTYRGDRVRRSRR